MLFLILFLICVFMAIGVGMLAGVSDVRGMTIPNIYSGVVIICFVLAYALAHFGGAGHIFSSISSHLLSGLLTFVITAILFAMKMIGAADSKIGSAYALWLGVVDLPIFLAYMSLAGGVLAVASLYMMKKKPFKDPLKGSWMDRVQKGESKVPYGVAIAVGAIISFYIAGYMDGEVLLSFITV